jgi:hypothetical protein
VREPDCKGTEAEVGTLKFGCKTGHQSACWNSYSMGTKLYGYCKWVGTAPRCSIANPEDGGPSYAECPKSHPHFIFSSSAGFGGEKSCETSKLHAQNVSTKILVEVHRCEKLLLPIRRRGLHTMQMVQQGNKFARCVYLRAVVPT